MCKLCQGLFTPLNRLVVVISGLGPDARGKEVVLAGARADTLESIGGVEAVACLLDG